MKGSRKFYFSKHAITRAKERGLEIRKLAKLFRKSSFYRRGFKNTKVFKKDGVCFVAAEYEDRYIILTNYTDTSDVGIFDHLY